MNFPLWLVLLLLITCGCSRPIEPAITDSTQVAPAGSSVTPTSLAAGPNGPQRRPDTRGAEDDQQPHAVADEKLHDFGTLNLHEIGAHRFPIRNEGVAPLRLTLISTSCNCIAADLEQSVVPPGEVGHVAVQWKSDEVREQFLQAVSVRTNDPRVPIIRFEVAGRYLPVVAAEPPELFLPRIRPDETGVTQALIVSQQWDAFLVQNLESSLKDLNWSVEPAAESELARLQAKSGWRLTVQVPAGLPAGPFTHWIQFDVVRASQDTGKPQSQRMEMPLMGHVLRRIAVHGSDVDASGTLHLGALEQGSARTYRYLVKVNDQLPNIDVSSIDVVPAFLEATLEPYNGGAKEGLYTLKIELPVDAPSGIYRGDRGGSLSIQFDHPRIKELELGIDLIVLPRDRHGFHAHH